MPIYTITITANLPDSYFEPSAADLKYAQTTLQARAKALVDAPLQTQKLREEKEADRRKRWPTVCFSPSSLPA